MVTLAITSLSLAGASVIFEGIAAAVRGSGWEKALATAPRAGGEGPHLGPALSVTRAPLTGDPAPVLGLTIDF